MANTIKLNGYTFTVHKSKNTEQMLEGLKRYAYRWLDDCYTNPSETKKAIFKEWNEWAYLNDVEYFGVSGYNGFHFSLQGLVTHEGHKYILHITASSKKAYIVD